MTFRLPQQNNTISFGAAFEKSGIDKLLLPKKAQAQTELAKRVFNLFGDASKPEADKTQLSEKLRTLLIADGQRDKGKVETAVDKLERFAISNAKGRSR